LSPYVVHTVDLYSRKVITTAFATGQSPSWMSETAFLVADTQSLRLWQYDVISHTLNVFATLDTGNPKDRWITGAAYHPDSRYLVFLADFSGLYVADLECMEPSRN
jgi:hypothetical protein